jgi:tetratricopeptide (TPR) repeat protein
MWKIILLAAACLVAGFIVGGFLFVYYFTPKYASMMFILQEGEVIKFSEAAKEAYCNEPNETAVWALNYYIEDLSQMAKDRNPSEGEGQFFIINFNRGLAFAHARLGILYRKLGDLEKSQYHFDEAMAFVEAAGLKPITTQEDLEQFISKFDSCIKGLGE